MRKTIAILIVLGLISTVKAGDYKYTLGGSFGYVKLTGGKFFDFDKNENYGFNISRRLGSRWFLNVDYTSFVLTNDSTVDSTKSIGNIRNNAPVDFKTTRIGLICNRLLISPDKWYNLVVGFGGGVMIWKIIDSKSETTLVVTGSNNGASDFTASELYITASTGIIVFPVSNWSLNWNIRADYLTGAGAEFSSGVKSKLDKWLLSTSISLNFYFSHATKPIPWKSETVWATPALPSVRTSLGADNDGDGIVNESDSCLYTPKGVSVDRFGCPLDSDSDGVWDGLDDCPETNPMARGKVDIYGCEIDADFDGVPDYLDACPKNPIGAIVGTDGCPLDSDGDGVFDGLDDCPNTMTGLEVDHFGCIDLDIFSKPFVLQIDYPSGSFEIDSNSKKKLIRLAGILNLVPFIELEINGYTDNIGIETANQKLSEKRAARVRDYLVTLGVAGERIKIFGRGETDPIASNQTADGRSQNRRIEIIFYK